MLEPVSPSRHPVGDHLRKAAAVLERTIATASPDPWESLADAILRGDR